jgi:hypothetical protein
MLVRYVPGFHTLAKLQTRTPDYIYLSIIRLGLQMEKMLEKIKMGFDTQKCFTEMYKN